MTAGISKVRIYMEEYAADGSPDTPASGEWALFFRPDGVYTKDDAGTVAVVGGSGGVTDGDKGSITVSSGGTVWTIDNNAVTLAKLATQAANTILAEVTGSAAVPTAVAIAANKFLARASSGNLAAKDITDFALSMLDDANAGAVMTTLGFSANAQTFVTAANYAAMRAALGAAGVTLISTVPHKQLWIGNAKPTLTSGCASAAQIEMGTNKNVYDYLAFDKDSIEYAYANVAMPQDYTGGTIYATFWWTHPATTTNFKVSWGLQAVSFSDDDTLDAAQGTAQYSNDTGGTTSDLYVSPQTSAITIAGTPVAGDLVNFRILRKADDATNDTLAVDAYLLGVMIWYPVNA